MTAKIFRNAFLIGFTVLLACILLFFFIMYSNYQAQAFDNLAIEAEHISEGIQICGGEAYLSAIQVMRSPDCTAERYDSPPQICMPSEICSASIARLSNACA